MREYEFKRWDAASTRQRGQQDEALDDASVFLRQAESGDSSVAQQQLRQAASAAQAGAAAQAAAGGANPLAQRSAAYSAGQQQGQLGMQAAQLRAQEMQSAQQQMLQQRQMMSDAEMQRLGMAQDLFLQNRARALEQKALDNQIAQQNRNFGLSVAQGVFGAGSALAGAISDQDKKRRIVEDDDEAVKMLRQLVPATYEYTGDVPLPEGRYAGVMAQDLERSPMGATMVRETPEGKVVDTQQAAMAALGAAAALQRQVDELKKGRKK